MILSTYEVCHSAGYVNIWTQWLVLADFFIVPRSQSAMKISGPGSEL
jgi:hypothetical protein